MSEPLGSSRTISFTGSKQVQQFTPAIQAGYYLGIALAIIGFIMAIAGGIGIAVRSAKRGRTESI